MHIWVNASPISVGGKQSISAYCERHLMDGVAQPALRCVSGWATRRVNPVDKEMTRRDLNFQLILTAGTAGTHHR